MLKNEHSNARGSSSISNFPPNKVGERTKDYASNPPFSKHAGCEIETAFLLPLVLITISHLLLYSVLLQAAASLSFPSFLCDSDF